mmetsp:Transcript_54309/g.129422  ORF Transcript_54309/g.129422 Transcript_54309/m.129422 type:complete len:217 (+) Transcript_54309:897-1547(+)
MGLKPIVGPRSSSSFCLPLPGIRLPLDFFSGLCPTLVPMPVIFRARSCVFCRALCNSPGSSHISIIHLHFSRIPPATSFPCSMTRWSCHFLTLWISFLMSCAHCMLPLFIRASSRASALWTRFHSLSFRSRTWKHAFKIGPLVSGRLSVWMAILCNVLAGQPQFVADRASFRLASSSLPRPVPDFLVGVTLRARRDTIAPGSTPPCTRAQLRRLLC